ncbi:MAG TPA: tryptophan--tRNA ligase, partial [Candidatus Saccharimonadales bacterium]|nr:tryptophan--tRNA ligase [Candidatus Saccharimonadales bacterium]
PAHSELTWILDCFTGVGEMNRMTQFKDKSLSYKVGSFAKVVNETSSSTLDALTDTEFNERVVQDYQPKINIGLFNYPVLMAADILLYHATYVPVGDDQTQHLEFTRDIAERMNARFNNLFTVPLPVPKQHEFFGRNQGLRIRDLQNPTKKMSKSDESGKGVIFLTDSPEVAAKKIMGATTDSLGKITYDFAKQPGISNLLQLLALLTQRDQAAVNAMYQGQATYGPLKADVSKAMADFLRDFQTKLAAVKRSEVITTLETNEQTARAIATKTLLEVQKAVGLRAA